MVDKINGNSSYDFPGSQKRKNPALKAYENTPGSKDAAGKRAAGIAGKNSPDAYNRKESGVILDLSGKAAGKQNSHTAGGKKDASWKVALRKLVAPVVRWLKDFWNSDSPADTKARMSVDRQEGAKSAGLSESMQPDSDLESMQPDSDLESMQLNSDLESIQPDSNLEPMQPDSDLEPMQPDSDLEPIQLDNDLEPMQPDMDLETLQQISDRSVRPAESIQETEALREQQLKALADRAVKSGDLRQIEQFLTQNGVKRLAHNSDLLTYYDRRGKFVELDETEKHRVLFGDKNVLKL